MSALQEAIAERWTLDDEGARSGRSIAYRGRTASSGEPEDVGTAVDRLLAKAPAARFPDAEHLVDALSGLT